MTESTLSAVIGAGWMAVAGWACIGLGRSPGRRRVEDLPRWTPPTIKSAVRDRDRVSVTQRLGTAVLDRVRYPGSPLVARRTGTAGLAFATLMVLVLVAGLSPLVAVAGGAMGWAWPAMAARRLRTRQRSAIAAEIPEVVDLLNLVVGGGMTVCLAVAAVGDRGRGRLAAELARAADQAQRGRRLADALEELRERLGDEVRPLVAVLVASERYGAPLGAALERLATDARLQCRRRAEEAARKIPIKLLFPLVSCTLPAFALLTVAPLIVNAVRSLRL